MIKYCQNSLANKMIPELRVPQNSAQDFQKQVQSTEKFNHKQYCDSSVNCHEDMSNIFRCPFNNQYEKCEVSQHLSNNLNKKEQENEGKQTIGHLIDGITFDKKKHIKKSKPSCSQSSSQESLSSYEFDTNSVKSDQSKCWDSDEQQLFQELLHKYGTDFNFIKQFFPRKSKSQIKNKYKQLANVKKKMSKRSWKPLKQTQPMGAIQTVKQAKQMLQDSQNQPAQK